MCIAIEDNCSPVVSVVCISVPTVADSSPGSGRQHSLQTWKKGMKTSRDPSVMSV